MAGKRTAPDTQRMGLQAEKIWQEAEGRIMEDVIRRIKKTGEITSTADYQINRLIEMGKSREEVERIVKDALGSTWAEMFEMYDRVAEWEYVRNREIYEQVNDDFIAPEDNEWLKQLTSAVRKQTKDTLQNMSQSYGFSVLIAGKKVFTPFAEYYQKYVDTAMEDVVTGGMDYNSVIRRVVTQMTNSGLRFVDYASGHTNRADVAARRAVLTGINQITAQVSEHNAEKLDTEYFEVSWHPCARPDHQTWQGKVFSKKQLETVCGYGTVTGLCGANCRHTFHPFIPGVSERLYPDDWLEEQNQKEAKTKEWNGRQLNAYEQTQQQRKMETAMRAQREKVRLLQQGGADPDEITLQKAKYQGQLNEYSRFSKKMGLPEQRERIYQDMRGRVATSIKERNAQWKTVAKAKETGIMESDLGTFKQKLRNDENIGKEYYDVLKEKFSHGRDDAKRVFAKYASGDTIENSFYEGVPHFNTKTKKISMHYGADLRNERGAGATWFHEHGHLIDDALGVVSSDEKFKELLEDDSFQYRIRYGKEHDLKTYEKVDKAISSELQDMHKHSAVADLLEGLTQGNISGCAGHKSDYWDNPENITSEAFAHMFEAQFNKIRYNEMKKYFPGSLSYFENKLKEVAK